MSATDPQSTGPQALMEHRRPVTRTIHRDPAPSLISRALRHALMHCRTMFQAEMYEHPPGTDPPPAALVWREQAQQYREILAKIEPKRKPKRI